MRLIIIDGVTVAEIAEILGTRLEEKKEETTNTLPHASWYIGKRVQSDDGIKPQKGIVNGVMGDNILCVTYDGESGSKNVSKDDVTVLQ